MRIGRGKRSTGIFRSVNVTHSIRNFRKLTIRKSKWKFPRNLHLNLSALTNVKLLVTMKIRFVN
jgi:hypothetical protein